ncbi:MAG: hypothetical protein QF893_18050 [Alphaproteobacteria bacterium]|nr:hypothetical protein [Alphaproteobacteria bacterium]
MDVPPPQQPVHWWDIEQKVWGEGFSDPVSGPFLTALIKPLEPESYSELLLLGAGFGGAASEIVSRHGAKVAAHEAVTELAEAATAHWAASAMEKPPAIEPCDLAVATLPSRTFDGGLALNAFLPVGDKAGALKRIEQALKLRKRLVILEAFADEDIDPKSEVFQAWRDAEPTPVHLMSYSDFEAVLQETGFTLLDQKDLTAAYQDLITGGWAKAMRTLRPPTDGSVDADAFVECVMRQCRRWTLLSTLLKEEKLRIYLVNAQVGESAKLMSDW